jgi:hypothetical protein
VWLRVVCTHLIICDLVLFTCPEDGGDTFLQNVGFGTAATYWPSVPASGDSEDDCGEADGM